MQRKLIALKRDQENVMLEGQSCYTTISKLEDQLNVGVKKESVDAEIFFGSNITCQRFEKGKGKL